ncbi:Neutral zinc metallopeptidase, Zn-binding site [Phytophthora cinnamomi]|uniref:Neutral zinc metallopeptidase, Zn-binding site n=1 Tax=Phytophthora cinnamomi TaxID=4785 RepID=UPI00355A54E5|nr:Neutral zinc metallopeptidase, Zn-binding site [Phytophthora cinnamomi]
MATSFAIAEVKALVRQPQRAQAQQILERLAAAVLPILTRRRFCVRRLLEFFPKDGCLLGMNVNRGAKIYVRLRPQRSPGSFLPYEALLETLLHELTHMVHGPHNQAFYQYLDELKQEMESLMVRGLVGEEGARFAGAGEGQRLGGDSAGVPIRVAAVLAARRREQYNSLLGGERSRRLGSKTSSGASREVLDPQTLRRRVLEAAERRRRDNELCKNVLREGASHEVLGIESSDEDEDAFATSTLNSEVSNPQRSSKAEVIILDDEKEAVAAQAHVRATSRRSDYATPPTIDLVEDEDEEKSEKMPNKVRDSSSREFVVERNRKRRRQEDLLRVASDVIDLT